MKVNKLWAAQLFFCLALFLLVLGLLGGVLGAITYVVPDFLKDFQGLSKLRPLHVSYVMFWILTAAIGGVYGGLSFLSSRPLSKTLIGIQLFFWLIALLGISYAYWNGYFGGREYWEFNPIWALPIALSWLVFLIHFFYLSKGIKKWPVYVWMWMTGTCFFFFIFLENYLWLFPYFRSHFVTDMTIQWKVNGSLVGSFNQLVYGVSFFVMDRISGIDSSKIGSSKRAFAMYFLGLFNLMFNWGHHIYTLPTADYIRYVGYLVSMTEWIIFINIVYNWRKSLEIAKRHYYFFPYRFMVAADIWVFINVGIATLLSIPVLNIYTHGTHVTVAHSMGTTIGINTMILFSTLFLFFTPNSKLNKPIPPFLNFTFWLVQASLLIFFIALNIAGLIKGLWQLDPNHDSFGAMMQRLQPYFWVFLIAGIVLAIAILAIIIKAVKYLKIKLSEE